MLTTNGCVTPVVYGEAKILQVVGHSFQSLPPVVLNIPPERDEREPENLILSAHARPKIIESNIADQDKYSIPWRGFLSHTTFVIQATY